MVCDALGSPQEMFDAAGALVWAADRHAWGAVRAVRAAPRPRGGLALAEAQPFAPQPNPGLGPERDPLAARFLCPWRFPGQYEDAETGLFYNRHRHYDPLTGQYASPDPIGLAGGDRPQGYVANPTAWADPLGLNALKNVDPYTLTPTHSISGTRSSKTVRYFYDKFKAEGKFSGDPIIVVRHGDKSYVVDGHHRLLAAKRAGVNADIKIVDPSSVFSPGGYRNMDDIINSAITTGPNNIRGPGGVRW